MTIRRYFVPQPDITAYELALFVANFAGGVGGSPGHQGVDFPDQEWADLPTHLRRHFDERPIGSLAEALTR